MSFSTQKYYWLAITFAGALLIGCATTPEQEELPGVVDDKATAELVELFAESEQSAPSESKGSSDVSPVIEEAPEPEGMPLLPLPAMETSVEVYDWEVISGAKVGNMFVGFVENRFSRPVSVAARNGYVYVVDEGAGTLYRYDRASGRISSLLDLTAEVKGAVADIYVLPDFSFYITDTDGSRVLQYDRHGRLMQIYRDHFNLVQPVAIAVADNGDLIVADAHYDQLLRFNGLGKLIATYGSRGQDAAEFINITSMAIGPDGYYVGARVGRRIQVLSLKGEYAYSFEEGGVVFPTSIVIDRNNRSYVSDQMDNSIKVFDRGHLIATMGGAGTAPGQFMRITDMWLDEGFLYIVDSLNGRIQVAKVQSDQASELEMETVLPQ